MKIVQQSVGLPASPADLYAMYLDATAHAAFTGGGAAVISATPATDWSAFDGRIHGRILALAPGEQVVQSWRSFEWRDEEPDSVLVLRFAASGAGTRIDLAQVGVPERLYETLDAGWPTRYWDSWRAYLLKGK